MNQCQPMDQQQFEETIANAYSNGVSAARAQGISGDLTLEVIIYCVHCGTSESKFLKSQSDAKNLRVVDHKATCVINQLHPLFLSGAVYKLRDGFCWAGEGCLQVNQYDYYIPSELPVYHSHRDDYDYYDRMRRRKLSVMFMEVAE